MDPHLLTAAIAPVLVRSAWRWMYHLGGLGFIPLGLLDSSIMPVPGSMDVLTIVLAARNSELWLYYALMATVGSVIGGFATYRLARKGGKEMLASRFPQHSLERFYAIFEKWGFGAIAIPAIMPPPVPFVPFLLAAGAMQYSVQKFLAALTFGRILRFSALAFLAARYGQGILALISIREHPALVAVIAVIAVAVVVFYVRYASKKQRSAPA